VSSSSPQEIMASFFEALREKGFHLGLEPEFSTIQELAVAPRSLRFPLLRDHIDQFFFARGFQVLERLSNAAQQTNPDAARMLDTMGNVIREFLTGQFAKQEGQTLPHPSMLREMMRRFNEEGADSMNNYIEQNIDHLDGYFFMTLSTALRNAHGAGHQPTIQMLILLGGLVVSLRREHGLPCSFGPLFGL
jgi:hypothetical protein